MLKIKPIISFCCCLILFSILFACSARRDANLFAAPTDIVTDTIKHVYVVNDQGTDSYYKIKPGDLLAVRNLQNKEFGATSSTVITSQQPANIQQVLSYEVEPDGKVNLPAIGKVAVAGLSRRETSAKIEALYREKLLVDPIIELSIINIKVTVLGEFQKQGNFLLERDNVNLIEIIAEAGGVLKTADRKSLKIIRGNKSNPEIIYVNLNDINSLASKKLMLQDHDIIVLQASKNALRNEKLQSFNNLLQPILIVVNLAVLIFTLSR